MTVIRAAEERDVPWLLEELRAFARYYEMPWLVPELLSVALTRVLSLVHGGPWFVAEKGGSRAGFIGGVIGEHPFNPAIVMLTELFWWVTPAYRGSTAGARLLTHFEGYGRLMNAHHLSLSLPPHASLDPQSLERRGYVLRERSYLLDLQQQTQLQQVQHAEVTSPSEVQVAERSLSHTR